MAKSKSRLTVGFVGLGIIGSAFSKHLRLGGFPVRGYDPDGARQKLLRSRGGTICASAAEVAASSDVVVTAIASEIAYDQAYFGVDGLQDGARRGQVVIDVSTMPLGAKYDHRTVLAQRGVEMLDCPISGTGAQAETRDIAVYASGDKLAVDAVMPVLEGFSRKVWYVGDFGGGSKLKYLANLLVTIHNVSAAEAITLGIKSGLDPKLMFEALASGAGTSRMFEVRGPLMLADDYDKPTMKMDVYQKDIDIITDFAAKLRCPTPLFDASRGLYAAGLGQGRDKQDTAAVCAVLKEMAGIAPQVARPSAKPARRPAKARSRRRT